MNIDISFTDAACTYIKKMLSKENGIGFRLTIKKQGCSGFAYIPKIISEINPQDHLIETHELKIFIDVAWMHLMQGLQVDYVEEEVLGIKQKRLVFINPNETSRCGCGESFHVETLK